MNELADAVQRPGRPSARPHPHQRAQAGHGPRADDPGDAARRLEHVAGEERLQRRAGRGRPRALQGRGLFFPVPWISYRSACHANLPASPTHLPPTPPSPLSSALLHVPARWRSASASSPTTRAPTTRLRRPARPALATARPRPPKGRRPPAPRSSPGGRTRPRRRRAATATALRPPSSAENLWLCGRVCHKCLSFSFASCDLSLPPFLYASFSPSRSLLVSLESILPGAGSPFALPLHSINGWTTRRCWTFTMLRIA